MFSSVTVEGDPKVFDAVEATPAYRSVQGQPLSYVTPISERMGRSGRAMKRTLDIVLAALALLVIAPLMLLIMVAVWLASPGRPFFAQLRVGRDGQVFRCWKFRSMHRDAEAILRRDPDLYASYVANDFKLTCDDDPRVTAIGRFLRQTSLDELPQLFNVLAGQMSLVGPRPVVPDELERCYGPWIAEYVAVRPGITGPWQISGRNDIRYPERAVLDARYVHAWTFRGDLAILARTPRALLRKAGTTTTGTTAGTTAEVIALHPAYEIPAVAHTK
jgi:exopolysaccharide production protein ExoY